jgi:hypothetical protein
MGYDKAGSDKFKKHFGSLAAKPPAIQIVGSSEYQVVGYQVNGLRAHSNGLRTHINRLSAHNPFAERREAQFRKLQVLNGKGDADNRNGRAEAKNDMGDHYPDSAEDEPDNVQKEVYTAISPRNFNDIHPEWRHSHPCQLQGLNSRRDTDYGKAQGKASQKIPEGNENPATQKKPQHVGYEPDKNHLHPPVYDDCFNKLMVMYGESRLLF